MAQSPNTTNFATVAVDSSKGYSVNGTVVIDENGNIDAPITTTDAVFTGNTTLGNAAVDTVTINGTTTANAPITVGVDGTGHDVQFFGDTAGASMLWDESADTLILGGAGKLTVASTTTLTGKVTFGLNGGAASASGILMGVGTSGSPAATAVADTMFAEFRTRSSATSGSTRGLYWRHEMTGAGASGESIRSFTKVSAAVGTARGAHVSLDINTTGSITGLGAGIDGQLYVPNQAVGGGTLTAVNAEIYSDGASSTIAGSTTSFFRAVAGGNATGAATIDSAGYLMSIQGLTVGSGKLFQANTAAAATHALKILIGGTPYYIMLTDTGA